MSSTRSLLGIRQRDSGDIFLVFSMPSGPCLYLVPEGVMLMKFTWYLSRLLVQVPTWFQRMFIWYLSGNDMHLVFVVSSRPDPYLIPEDVTDDIHLVLVMLSWPGPYSVPDGVTVMTCTLYLSCIFQVPTRYQRVWPYWYSLQPFIVTSVGFPNLISLILTVSCRETLLIAIPMHTFPSLLASVTALVGLCVCA